MKKRLTVGLLFVLALGFQTISAQFPIKIPKLPKIEKPKPEQPKTETNSPSGQITQNESPQNQSNQNQSVQNNSSTTQPRKIEQPIPPAVPKLLTETLEIRLELRNKYWKFPNQRYYSNWIPQVNFELFYDNNERLRYTAEWFKPDGSLWFGESLEARDMSTGVIVKSPYNGALFDNSSTDQIGVYGLKITNSNTKETVFQGKFNVKKSIDTPGDAQMKNSFQFFVDNDWHLAVGYAGFSLDNWKNKEIEPEVLLWFKGAPERKDLAAGLFFDNQKIASTDDGGLVIEYQKRGDSCVRGQEICRYVQYSFRWAKFKTEQEPYMRQIYPNAIFTQDKPGEYTIKVFHKGVQVREAKFTIAPGGLFARNSISNNVYPTLIVIPVKVTGTSEKWNSTSWKTAMFYGNPLSGFTVQ